MAAKPCPTAKTLRSALEESPGGTGLSEGLRAHVEGCSECKSLLSGDAKSDAILRTFFDLDKEAPPAMPPAFLPALMARLERPGALVAKPAPEPRWFWPGLLAGALALGVVILAVSVVPRHRESPISEPVGIPRSGGVEILNGSVQDLSGKMFAAGQHLIPGTGEFRSQGISELRLPSGVRVILTSARFTLPPSGMSLKSGLVTVKTDGKKVSFQLSSPVSLMGIRGTAFSARVEDSGKTSIEVTEGIVHVATISNQEMELRAGQRVVVSELGELVPSGASSTTNLKEAEPVLPSKAVATETANTSLHE